MLRHVYDVFPTHMGRQREGLKGDEEICFLA